MSMTSNNDKLTICEVLRQINDRLQGESFTDIRDMLALAEQMAKKIVSKLREYNEKEDPDKWLNIDIRESFDRSMQNYLSGNADRGLELLIKDI